MSATTVGRTPSPSAVAVEQTKVVGLAMRWELLATGALLLCGLLAIPFVNMFETYVDGEPATSLNPADLGILAAIVALVTPLGVWKGESRFGESRLWTLPVDHARHARMKVAAGWLWLMAVTAVGLLAVIAMALMLDDGALGIDVTRTLVVDPAGAAAGLPDALREVVWSTPWWQWLIPFTAATAAYLAATALWVGMKHPLWWAGGIWLFLQVSAVVAELDVAGFRGIFDAFFGSLDAVVTGGGDTLRSTVRLPTGERVRAWTAMPAFGRWAWITLGWTLAGLVAVWGATARHREA